MMRRLHHGRISRTVLEAISLNGSSKRHACIIVDMHLHLVCLHLVSRKTTKKFKIQNTSLLLGRTSFNDLKQWLETNMALVCSAEVSIHPLFTSSNILIYISRISRLDFYFKGDSSTYLVRSLLVTPTKTHITASELQSFLLHN